MSKKQHSDATLEGWNGPFFPESLKQIRETQNNRNIKNGDLLEKSGKRVCGFRGIYRPQTSDGYFWFWGLVFLRLFGQAAVLFPWAQDWNAEDGDQSDRSIAIYTKGYVNVEHVIRQLTKAMEKTRKREEKRYR